ncbi:hypothetical protein MMC14_005770 [Varicellaria rhodocarpa]|nr:hypothetical protein [Varicellaria rhodocarpa]
MDNLFIDALVRAGTCWEHAYQGIAHKLSGPQNFSQFGLHWRLGQNTIGRMRSFSSSPFTRVQPLVCLQEYSQDDYKQMVDHYEEPTYDGDTSVIAQSQHRPPDITPKKIEEKIQGLTTSFQNSEEIVSSTVHQMINMLNSPEADSEKLFDFYKELPFPGVLHIPWKYRNKLLQRLSVVEKKSRKAMLRYMCIVDDMKAAGLSLDVSQWTSAVHLVGRCYSIVTAVEVESALRMWKEMEEEADVRSSHITFNILFDIAVKSGKFVLAEMILQEMETRHLKVNRFAHVGLIYYYGLRHDGDKVRKAYRDLIEAGQIVDTVVLNCVIVSLIRAGELPAAEQVYQRMKAIRAKRIGARLPPTNFKRSRELARVLDQAAIYYKKDPERRKQLQREQSLSPDVHTYVIFLQHHVSETGELQRIADLLDEMQLLRIPIHGRLFMELFRGFSLHGGVRYSSWTAVRLESVWSSFMDVLENETEDVFVGKWIAIWAIRAFVKCCGKKRSIEIWDELRSRWKASEKDTSVIYSILVGDQAP